MPEFRLAIAGGGTGGHLFPGIAVAKALKTRMADAKVLFVVGRRRMETDILSRAGFEAVSIDVEGIKGRSWKKGLPVIFRLPKSIFQSVLHYSTLFALCRPRRRGVFGRTVLCSREMDGDPHGHP